MRKPWRSCYWSSRPRAKVAEKDVVIVAGKGHEDYQIIGGVTYPFSDRQVIEESLHVAG